jgi:hypothetical protein
MSTLKDTETSVPAADVASPIAVDTPAVATIASKPVAAIAATAEITSPQTNAAAPSSRFALLAASVGFAAALGAVIGSLSTMSLARAPEVAADTTPAPDQGRTLKALAQIGADVTALKTSIETSNRGANSQFTKISERLDRTERAQAEPAAKLAALTESFSRLEHRIAPTADVTGSITAKDPAKPSILEGWVVRDIYRGRAVVENRNRAYEVGPGSNLPGIGRIEAITQQNGRWVVVTPKGLIVSMR